MRDRSATTWLIKAGIFSYAVLALLPLGVVTFIWLYLDWPSLDLMREAPWAVSTAVGLFFAVASFTTIVLAGVVHRGRLALEISGPTLAWWALWLVAIGFFGLSVSGLIVLTQAPSIYARFQTPLIAGAVLSLITGAICKLAIRHRDAEFELVAFLERLDHARQDAESRLGASLKNE